MNKEVYLRCAVIRELVWDWRELFEVEMPWLRWSELARYTNKQRRARHASRYYVYEGKTEADDVYSLCPNGTKMNKLVRRRLCSMSSGMADIRGFTSFWQADSSVCSWGACPKLATTELKAVAEAHRILGKLTNTNLRLTHDPRTFDHHMWDHWSWKIEFSNRTCFTTVSRESQIWLEGCKNHKCRCYASIRRDGYNHQQGPWNGEARDRTPSHGLQAAWWAVCCRTMGPRRHEGGQSVLNTWWYDPWAKMIFRLKGPIKKTKFQ